MPKVTELVEVNMETDAQDSLTPNPVDAPDPCSRVLIFECGPHAEF